MHHLLRRFRDLQTSNTPVLLTFLLILLAQRTWYLFRIKWPITYPDTGSYFEIGLWENPRLYVIPFIYDVIEHPQKIIIFQCLLSLASQITLLRELLLILEKNSVVLKLICCVAYLSLCVTTPIFMSDFILLSESISISITLILIASIISCVRRASKRKFILASIIFIFWIATKSAHVLSGSLALILLQLLMWRYRRTITNKYIFIIFTFTSVAYIFILLQIIQPNEISRYNIVAMFHFVIERNPEWSNWFFNRGWPRDYMIFDSMGEPMISESIVAPNNIVFFENTSFNLYKDFLFAHPRFLLLGALILPLIGGKNFVWGDTPLMAILQGRRWPQETGALAGDNVLGIWWYDSITPIALISTIFFTILSVMIIWNFVMRNQLESSERSKDPGVETSVVIFVMALFFIFRISIEWLAAPTDLRRIWIEHAIALRVLFILFGAVSIARRQRIRATT